ncbi:MAG: NAD(P)/FAD-dependent oxidoreductase [Candidatus Aminicenantes bacterium]|nr:MAG: NAD(P)/FAD-dependent oxidoreductase [Candidatus Aminicenantes bacterium]
MHDVIVVGAGPSGLNAAKILTEKGLDVLVLEKKSEVGKHITCAGIVGGEVFSEFQLSEESVLKKIREIKIVSPDSNIIYYKHPDPFAYIVDRERFDKSIARDIEERKVKIQCDSKVENIHVDNDSVQVWAGTNGKQRTKFTAQIVLIATGVNYSLHKKLDLGYPKDFLHGAQAELDLGPVDCTHMFLGKDIAAGAFAWLVPIGPKIVKVGLITESDPEGCFQRLIEKHFPSHLQNLDRTRVQFKPIAQGLTSKTYGERVLVLGEAAGHVKTTTGGGIYFGLVCSEIASGVVLRGFEKGDFTKNSLAEYEKLWKKSLQKEIRIGYKVRKFCAKLSDRQIEKIFKFIQSDGIIPLVQERGDFDWHSDLLLLLMKRIPFLQILKSQIVND